MTPRAVDTQIPRRKAKVLHFDWFVRLEKFMLDSPSDPYLSLLCGSARLAGWCGLRFSELIRTDPASLVLLGSVLRGRTWHSKTHKSGFTFGCVATGFLGSSSRSWVSVLLGVLRGWLGTLHSAPDFLLPSGHSQSARPASFSTSLTQLLALLFQWTSDETAFQLTWRSFKSSLICWGSQAGSPLEEQRAQGHHASTQPMSGLYARDDVLPAIRLQARIISARFKKWRPCLPVMRGGAAPLITPDNWRTVDIPSDVQLLDSLDSVTIHQEANAEILSDSDSNDSDSSSGSGSESPSDSKDTAAVSWVIASRARTLRKAIRWQGDWLPACRAASAESYSHITKVPLVFRARRHSACKKFASLTVV